MTGKERKKLRKKRKKRMSQIGTQNPEKEQRTLVWFKNRETRE